MTGLTFKKGHVLDMFEGPAPDDNVLLHETVVDRIEHELTTIARMGFSSYFLVVEEIVKRSPRICGRGSGAASIVAYCRRT